MSHFKAHSSSTLVSCDWTFYRMAFPIKKMTIILLVLISFIPPSFLGFLIYCKFFLPFQPLDSSSGFQRVMAFFRDDNYYWLLLTTLIPVSFFATYVHWVSMKFYKHNWKRTSQFSLGHTWYIFIWTWWCCKHIQTMHYETCSTFYSNWPSVQERTRVTWRLRCQ